MTTQFDRIYHGLSPEVGKFRIAVSGMAWKAEEGEQMVAMQASDIKWAQWIRVARNYQLRIGLKDRSKETFDGFVREDHDRLSHLLKQHFSITLETKEVSFKGWNWGVTDFQGQDLAFLVSNRTAFELPLTNVANSNIAGRTEVSLEFAPRTAKPSRHGPDEMVEIRFYVPGTHTKERGSDAGSDKSDNEDEGEEISAAQAFHDLVKEKAELGQVSGDIILSFDEVNVLTPRGRYDVDMYPEFLRLRGRTYDYKILYGSISKLFLLPKDDLHVLFILGLNVPIRQGQTRYQYLVMQFNREEEITAELNMAEDEIAKYDRLKKNYEDPTYEVVSGVFRALSKKKIIGAGNFQSRNGLPSVKANLKAVQGDLFLLEKYIFFVSKQPTLIELSDIHQVVFSRLGASMGATAARTFDVKIVLKSGSDFTFTSLNKEEHEPFNAFLLEKKVKTKTEKMEGDLIMAEDEDEEMQSVASSGEEVPKPRRGGDDDDDSEDDEDFEASASDSGSPTDTDSDSDGGHTASDASGDRDLMKAAKKGKAKAVPKKKAPAKKAKADESDAEDDNDGDKPKKAAPKPKPKPKAKAKDDDAMDVDEEERPKAKPKPKPKPKAKDDEDGPAKKKQKTKAD
ncbi:SSrecog-domain-containing protein [Lentinus tigrinus ALCF2SS1-7]|uniref:FACT complex subunit POB3 n=1 Tax=Lentinus tigrinus ALCF2SS1-6 TaxID=1328759 RepID=A0A5C2SHA6_9APHY|nr:SSrecog-domain-containing protein [Lentinus tigrinus ALCF2SS1-6]RPD77571.1 SSrecog-domain-containing protein [Lentinus tigrinus ALCF2SS1-7]